MRLFLLITLLIAHTFIFILILFLILDSDFEGILHLSIALIYYMNYEYRQSKELDQLD